MTQLGHQPPSIDALQQCGSFSITSSAIERTPGRMARPSERLTIATPAFTLFQVIVVSARRVDRDRFGIPRSHA